MKKLIGLLALVVGCTHYEFGPELKESGTVVAKYFSPDTNDVSPIVGGDGNVSFVFSGDDAHYRVVFRCQHGKFEVDDRNAYEEVREGDWVEIRYKEKFKVTYDQPMIKQPSGFKFVGVSRIER